MIAIHVEGHMLKRSFEQNIGEHDEVTLWVGSVESKEKALEEFGFLTGVKIKHENTCFESHKGFDYLSFLVPSEDLTEPKAEHIEVFVADKAMLLFHDGNAMVVESWVEALLSADEKAASLNEALLNFIGLLIARFIVCLNKIEDHIADLEDALVKEENRDYVGEVSTLRKKLLILRRYYESMLAITEDLEENRNGLLGEDELRLLHFQTQKAERLYRDTLNLRDYITQVREAYQALLDIESNNVMKLFTVITSIFLPLTLLVGWYGMNLSMPETASRYTYPVVIVVSVFMIVGAIIYFKRKRWF